MDSSSLGMRGACAAWVLVLAGCGGSSGDDDGSSIGHGGVGGSASHGQGQSGTSGATGAGVGATAGVGSIAGSSGASGAGGAAAAAGGGSPGAGGSTGGALTKYDACIAYARTIENRFYRECLGAPLLGPDERAMREDDCPDLLFADGSNRTIDDVMRCAEQWRATPCSELLDRKLPECMPFGSRPLDAGCMFNVQCASGRCGGTPDGAGCKRCVEDAAVGASCVDPGVQCPLSAPCDGSVCAPLMSTPITSAECGQGMPCPDGSVCAATAPGVLECIPIPGSGETCEGTCAEGFSCSAQTNTCVALPAVGQPCPDGACEQDAYCHDGLVFDPSPMELPPVCMARLARGEVCITGATNDERGNGACALDLVCACDDDACSSAHCIEELRSGEPCGAPSTRCVAGTECVAGACTGVESQGLSDACR